MWVERQRNNNLLLLKISWQLALKKVFVVCHTTFAPKVKNILWLIIFEKKTQKEKDILITQQILSEPCARRGKKTG